MKKATLAAIAASLATLLAACGQQQETQAPAAAAPAEAAAAPAPQANPVAQAAEPVAANAEGEKIFKSTCSLCHATGAAGAPILGNKEDWAPRIAQGNDVLYKHAIEGYTGAKGVMPAKGGNVSLTDEAVKAAVDHMVASSQ